MIDATPCCAPATHIEFSDHFSIPSIRLTGDDAILEPWILDTVLSSAGATLHIRDEPHLLLLCDGAMGVDFWGNFWAMPQDSVLPTGMTLNQQSLDNFYWDHCHSSVPTTFGNPDQDGLGPGDYLDRLFQDEPTLSQDDDYRHGGYLRVNGVRAGDLRLLRKWVARLQTNPETDLGEVVELHGVRLRARDFAIRWCLWCIRYGTLFRLRHALPKGTDEVPGRRAACPSEPQGWLGIRPPRRSTGGKAPRKTLAAAPAPKAAAAAAASGGGSDDQYGAASRERATRASKRKR